MGEAHGERGDPARAIEHLRAALEIYRGVNVPYWPALARLHLARACLRAGDTAQAQAVLDEARQAAGPYETAGIEAAARRELARVALRRGDPRTALGHAEAAVAAVESERARIDQEDFKTTYFASMHEYYQTCIDALMALDAREPTEGHARRALHVSERARGRRVLEALQESALDLRSAADPTLVAHEQALRQELSALASQQARLVEQGAPAAQRAVTERKLRELEGQRQEAVTQLRQSSPAYAALVHPPILEADGIQGQLEPDTALLEYALGEERSYLWVVTRGSIVARELPGGEAIDGPARALYQALATRRADRKASEAAAALSRLILPEDLGALGATRLVVVADGALRMVPFAALPLASRFEIAYAPSASWVATLRRLRQGASPPPKALAVLADPVFDRADRRVRGGGAAATPAPGDERLRLLPRLPFSRREALAAASLLAKSDVLVALDFDASRERALSPELARYRIVHFASHSLLDDEHPGLSGVVLSLVDRRGTPRDGFLRLQDVYNLHLPAELVVLSACQTAMGKAVPGEGLLGLARGFMYAGAARVVASLWPVDEVATTELMAAFYRALLEQKDTPSQALRRAQRALASKPRWRAAYYWAGFVLQGDWR
jgi:CHAT domain-containing protein